MLIKNKGMILTDTKEDFIKTFGLEDELYNHFNTTIGHMNEDIGNDYSFKELIVYFLKLLDQYYVVQYDESYNAFMIIELSIKNIGGNICY